MFAVVDCNNFFVSCEKVFNPSLEGRAVVVLSNNDGCVVSRSQEAKDIGIKMGMPAFEMKNSMGLRIVGADNFTRGEWNKTEVVAFSSNYNLYGDMSSRVMRVLQEIVPCIEQYSIDESFVEFNGYSYDELVLKAKEIVYKIRKYTGVPVCVGIASTKTLAKVANRFAKKYKGFNGYCIIENDIKREKALKLLQIGDVWGIGRRYSKFLKGEGVVTAYDFITKSAWWVKKNMGIVGLRTQMELMGRVANKLEMPVDKKSITTSRSFGEMVSALEDMESAVSGFAASCAKKLRLQNSVAACVTVFILTNYYREDLPKYYNSITLTFPEATDDTFEIVSKSIEALHRIYKEGFMYKKVGVIVSDICSNTCVQQNLFVAKDVSKINSLNSVLDSVNAKYGNGVLKLAVEGGLLNKDNEDYLEKWRMKRLSLSGNFTTDLKDIIVVRT